MKYLTLVLLCSAFLFACKNDKGTLRDTTSTTPTTPTTASPSATGVVFHYTCPNNCANSGGDAAGSCPVCGSAYQHNQAYHAQQTPTTTTPNNNNGLSPIIQQPTNPGVVPPTTTTPEPAQNTAGIWHYTCANGCAGGAGSAIACATCGSVLQHNTTYHN